MTDQKNTSEQVAKEFLILHSTPQEREFADYYQKFTTGQVNERDLNHYVGLMKKEYGPLMSQAAFDKAMANRFIPWHDLIIQDEDYNIFIDSIELSDKEIYGDAREHYNFSISLQVEFPDKTKETTSVRGDLVLLEEEDGWKVDAFLIDDRILPTKKKR